MSAYAGLSELATDLKGAARLTPQGDLKVTDQEAFRTRLLDRITWTAVFAADEPLRDAARWAIRAAAPELGVVSASIQGLYDAIGQGKAAGFTVPAYNLRAMAYDAARALFRAAQKLKVGPFLFEIARSEIGYTEQRPAEYAAVCTAAAIREGHQGPIFLQGDHFQLNAKKFQAEPEKEVNAVKALAQEAVAAGFYNIDIDSSTLVDLSFPTISQQQRTNYEVCAEITETVRRAQPAGVTISVGGEIGEVGKKNSTVEELRAFMNGYRAAIQKRGIAKGLSKMSVQTGTTHGGVPLPDGTVAQVEIDFETLGALSAAARKEFGLGGAVQHGASTLPEELFDKFPEIGTLEIHLATAFQNLVYEHPALPKDLREEMYTWLRDRCGGEREAGQTDEQFYYKTRKKATGPFKKKLWGLPGDVRGAIGRTLQARFELLMRKLNVADTMDVMATYVQAVPVRAAPPPAVREALR